MPIAIVTALGRSKKQALPIPSLLGTALLKRFLEDPAVENLAINSVAPRLLGTSVCKTSLDFSSMRDGCCRILLKPFEDLAGAAHADAGSLPQRYGNRFPSKKTH